MVHAFIAIGAVLFLAVASGFAFSMHEKASEQAAQQSDPKSDTAGPRQSEITSVPAQQPNQQKVEAMSESDSSSGSSNQSSSTTTVTVNGETTTVHGNGNVNKTYTSEDGKSKVKINVKNTVNSIRGEVTDDR